MVNYPTTRKKNVWEKIVPSISDAGETGQLHEIRTFANIFENKLKMA